MKTINRGRIEIMRDLSGYCTDKMILDAIEAIAGDELFYDDETGEMSAAHFLWSEGGRDEELRTWLDKNRPGWRDDAPLPWGAGELTAE